MVNFCIFEDDNYQQLLPLTYLQPACTLKVGAYTLLQRFQVLFDHGNISLHCRDYLAKQVAHFEPGISINKLNTGSPCLFLNGRVVMNSDLHYMLTSESTSQNFMFTYKGHVVALFLRGDDLHAMKDLLEHIPSASQLIETFRESCVTKELEHCHIIGNPWDMLSLNQDVLRADFKQLNLPGSIKGDIRPYTVIYNEENVFMDTNSQCEDFVVLDARKGPIIIGQNVTIQAHARLEGPLYIGNGTLIKTGAVISNTSISKHCKVGGEVSHSIIHSFTNKAHDGFCGHSVIGHWVNLGAMTSISNLKNNYNTIKVGSDKVDTKQQFLGAIVGNHVKTGIGTLINCGSRIGFGSALVGSDVHKGDIPAFSWGVSGKYAIHECENFLETAKIVFSRRSQVCPDHFPELISLVHDTLTVKK